MVNVKQNKVEDRPYGLFCVSSVTFLQIYLQICKEITNFANEFEDDYC